MEEQANKPNRSRWGELGIVAGCWAFLLAYIWATKADSWLHRRLREIVYDLRDFRHFRDAVEADLDRLPMLDLEPSEEER